MTKVEQKFLQNLCRAIDSDSNKDDLDPTIRALMSHVMEEKEAIRQKVLALLNRELESSVTLVRNQESKKLQQLQLLRKFTNVLGKTPLGALTGSHKQLSKKNFNVCLFGNKDNTELTQVEQREKEWKARVGHNENMDLQTEIKPFNLIKDQVSYPQPLKVSAFPNVMRFQKKNELIIGQLQEEIIQMQQSQEDQCYHKFLERNQPIQESQIDPKTEYSGSVDLITLVKRDNIFEVLMCLISNGTSCLLQRDAIGLTPLHWACKRGSTLILELLLHFDPPMNVIDSFGRSPMSMAEHQEHFDCIHMLNIAKTKEFKKDFTKYDYLKLFGELPNIRQRKQE